MIEVALFTVIILVVVNSNLWQKQVKKKQEIN